MSNEQRWFPNLARSKQNMNDGQVAPGVYLPGMIRPGPQPEPSWADEDVLEVTKKACDELIEAGIKCEVHGWLLRSRGEVPASVIGCMGDTGWGFERSWRYWVAKGPGIPPIHALDLFNKFGGTCRVEGHGAGPNPIEYNKGFGVGVYHVDTQEALNALAETIRTVRSQCDVSVVKE